jgi:CRISPR-associated protein Cmr1
MPDHFFCAPTSGKPIDQWNKVVGLLKDFRQKAGSTKGHPRSPGPDRSWYPEPDTIRRITGDFSSGHDPSSHLSGGNSLPDGFPRAEFGLPIVFKFKDDNGPQPEPQPTTLQPYVGGKTVDRGTLESPDIHIIDGEIKDRMASPLILKPLALSTNAALAIILPFRTRGVEHVALLDNGGKDLTPRHAVPTRDIAFAGYPDSPIDGLTTSGSALGAFLNLAVCPAGTHGVHSDTGYWRIP